MAAQTSQLLAGLGDRAPGGGLEKLSAKLKNDISSKHLRREQDKEEYEKKMQEIRHPFLRVVARTRRSIRLLFDPTSSSPAANFVQRLVFFFIIVSSVTFVIETLPQFYDDVESGSHNNVWFIVEAICVSFFSLELSLRYFSAASLEDLVKDPFNALDLVAVIPFWVELASPVSPVKTSVLRVVRLFRVFRVFKVSRYTTGLQIIGQTIVGTMDIFAMFIFLITIATIVFSALIFFSERGDFMTAGDGQWVNTVTGQPSQFQSIPSAFYWTIVTITTVGYGDFAPVTEEGRFVACIAMLGGLIVISLPTSIIGSHFTTLWESHLAVRDELELLGNDRKFFALALQSFSHVVSQQDLTKEVESIVKSLKVVNRDILTKNSELTKTITEAAASFYSLKMLTFMLQRSLESSKDYNDSLLKTVLDQQFKAWRDQEESNMKPRRSFLKRLGGSPGNLVSPKPDESALSDVPAQDANRQAVYADRVLPGQAVQD